MTVPVPVSFGCGSSVDNTDDSLVLKRELEERARAEGFEAVGCVPIPVVLRDQAFREWLEVGWHGDMDWLGRETSVAKRLDPQMVMPEVQTVIVVGLNYLQKEPNRRGRIAKYALGRDYHRVIYAKLKRICRWLRERGGINRPYVDTGPVMEKPLAALAGLGWQAKNTMLINREFGQWLFLGAILTSLRFPGDASGKDYCGSCTRCIDVCPTKALPAPYKLDARRCISYLTIECKGAIPEEFRRPIGNHLFGCDDCLDVCPWNRWAQTGRELSLAARDYPDVRDLLQLDAGQFAELFSGTPLKRLGLERLKRNACVVLGNIGDSDDLEELERCARQEGELVREHAEWALREIRRRIGA